MTLKKISNIERVLCMECIRDVPDFAKINKLFELGADINAVNEYGECVAAIVFAGYCSEYGNTLRSGYYVPKLLKVFLENGFDVRRNGFYTLSELQNGVYDKYIRSAMATIYKLRYRLFVTDCKKKFRGIKRAGTRVYKKVAMPFTTLFSK